MGAYRYTSTETRIYAEYGLTAEPGTEADWEVPPDVHWVPVEAPKKTTAKTPPAPAAPTIEE